MGSLRDASITIERYKCFGEEPQGFKRIAPLNLIIGKNNSGKSSLLEVVGYAIAGFGSEVRSLGHRGEEPRLRIGLPLQESEMQRAFPPSESGGGVPGSSLWEYGKTKVGAVVERVATPGANFQAIGLEAVFPEEAARRVANRRLPPLLNKLPFQELLFRRLRPDRDIRPERDSQKPELGENGDGATTIVRSFITDEGLPDELVETTLLEALNQIVEPSWCFTAIRTQRRGEWWELYLEEKGKPRVSLSHTGSGLKTVLLVLVYLLLLPRLQKKRLQDFVLAFEELENNLHPTLFRRLLGYLRDTAVREGCTIFLTTHSNVAIDLLSRDKGAQIVHLTRDGNSTVARSITEYGAAVEVLDDLGARPSDLLQTNVVVWVEGPSDRRYLRKWIELWSDGELSEGLHYQCMFYGGRLLSHLTAGDATVPVDRFVNVLAMNKHCVVLIDSDKEDEGAPINETKKRIRKEVEEWKGICWITAGREVENYVPADVLEEVTGHKVEQVGQYESFREYLNRASAGAGDRWKQDKVGLCERVVESLRRESLKGLLDLDDRLQQLCLSIRRWNGLDG